MGVMLMVEAGTEGAVLSESWSRITNQDIWLKISYIGRVVSKREQNGYDDSDFFAIVYDEEECAFKEICYATTRGWTYACGVTIDAPDCVKDLYGAYLQGKMEECKRKVIEIKRQHLIYNRVPENYIDKMLELQLILGDDNRWQACVILLTTQNFRSKFRESLASQLKEWLVGSRDYSQPFSPRQWDVLMGNKSAQFARKRFAWQNADLYRV